MRVTALLLAGTAGLVSSGAFAADLPSRKAAPVEYVRVCSTYGEGFFYIPGTNNCIRIGGRAAYDWTYAQPFSRGDNVTGTRATGRFYVDARTATEFGLLRTFVRVDVQRRMGALASGTAANIGTGFVGRGVDYTAAQTEVALNRAYVQWGGLTAGRSQSFFEFYAGDLELIGTTAGSSIQTNLLAYTASFGAGFSATLSLEDPIERRNTIQPLVAGLPAGVSYYAGASMPDVVGVLRYEGGWGAAQLSGAVHQVRSLGRFAAAGVVGGQAVGFTPGSDYGFALNGGVQFNLPFAEGDQLWLQATYTKGASVYINSNPFGYGGGGAGGFGALGGLMLPDAYLTPNGGSGNLSLPTVWGLTAAAQHYWTPTIRQAVFASYIVGDVPSATYAAALNLAVLPAGVVDRDFSYWTVGSNVTWSPIKDLELSAELNYLRFEAKQGPAFSVVPGNSVLRVTGSQDQILGRVRIQRDF